MLDFCIIGTPKAGTTSLFNWLDAHPDLQGARPKETHFFMDPDHPLSGIHGATYVADGISAYAQFFPNDSQQYQNFEATPQYFYQKTARDYLTSLDPQPLVIISLREPADRIHSSFRFTRDNLGYCDRSLTFDQYVECLLDDNTATLEQYFRADGSLYIAKRELQLGCYCDWLDWWLERLERDHLQIVLFDELKNNPGSVMKYLSDRLHINSDFYRDFDFSKDNATYPVGQRTIHRVIKPLGKYLPGGPLKDCLKDKYLAWQRTMAVPDSSYQTGLQKLRHYFQPENKKLADKYNLDIRQW